MSKKHAIITLQDFAEAQCLMQTTAATNENDIDGSNTCRLFVSRRVSDRSIVYGVTGPLIEGAHIYDSDEQLQSVSDYLVNAQHLTHGNSACQLFDVGDIEKIQDLMTDIDVGGSAFVDAEPTS